MKVRLKNPDISFVDTEGGLFSISGDEVLPLPPVLGAKTRACIQAGGLVVLDEASEEASAVDLGAAATKPDLPAQDQEDAGDASETVPSEDAVSPDPFAIEQRIEALMELPLGELRKLCKNMKVKYAVRDSAKTLAGKLAKAEFEG